MDYIHSIPALASFLEGSDYTDIKVFESSCSMRAFIAGMLSYNPWWLKLLYHIRGFLVRLLGLERQDSIDLRPITRPEDISFLLDINNSIEYGLFSIRYESLMGSPHDVKLNEAFRRKMGVLKKSY